MKIIDKEYATSLIFERDFLREHGISYTWANTDKQTGITVWKYKKTVQLFYVLAELYKNVYYK